MKLSACYIVRNEEQNITASLASIKQVVDEIIVVDTGSTDRTKELAGAYDAVIYDYPWQDDFSAPRNFAITKASGDWILFMDADEVLVSPESFRQKWEKLLEEAECDIILLRSWNIASLREKKQTVSYFSPRLFRNCAELRYQGRIHEQIVKSHGELKKRFAPEAMSMWHTGYQPQVIEAKLQRDLAILQMEIAHHGELPQYQYYLADCYYGLGRYQEAWEAEERYLRGDIVMIGSELHPYHIILECMRKLGTDLQVMLEFAQKVRQKYAGYPEFYAEEGMIRSALGQYRQALSLLMRALELFEETKEQRSVDSYFGTSVAAHCAARIAEILDIQEKTDEAAEWFQLAQCYDADSALVQQKYKNFQTKHRQREAVVTITACYIVKDEAADLRLSLASLQRQVDEILVVQTKADVAVEAVASSFQARILTYTWQDDFAAARNFALAHVRTNWVAFLDADEYFSVETAGSLRHVVEKYQTKDVLLVPWRNIDRENQSLLLMSRALRVFRADRGFKYVGRIHEELRADGKLIENIGLPAESELCLVHTGYSAAGMQAKAERNLKILLQELADTGDKDRLARYLAETYDALGDTDKAMYYARLDIKQGRKAVIYASSSYRLLLRRLAELPQAKAERYAVAQQAAREFPELPEFQAEWAVCLAMQGDLQAAIAAAGQALQPPAQDSALETSIFTDDMRGQLMAQVKTWQAQLKQQAVPLLTACVIVKNEEKNIAGWLANTAVFADQRIVVDTGSTDKTAALAKTAGCEVYDYIWQNDFAAAKNYALSKAKGAWIVFLDADEYFAQPEMVRNYVVTQLINSSYDAVLLPLVNIDTDDDNREIQRFPAVRIFRNDPQLHYHGRVHEQLVGEKGALHILQETEQLQVLHTGYASHIMLDKAKRNLALLQQDIAEHGEGPQHYRYLAECYQELGDYDKAELYALQAINSPLKAQTSQGDMYYLVLSCMERKQEPVEEQIAFAQAACQQFPELPDFYGWLGLLYFAVGRHEKAWGNLQKSATLGQAARGDTSQATHFADIAAKVYGTLAILYFGQGKREQASKYWEMGKQVNPYEDAVMQAGLLLADAGATAATLKNMQVAIGDDLEKQLFLARWLENNGYVKLYQLQSESLQQEYQKVLPRYDWYTKAQPAVPVEAMIETLAEDIRGLMKLLWLLDQQEGRKFKLLAQQCENLLPSAARTCWQAYQGAAVTIPLDGYRSWYDSLAETATETQLIKFLSLLPEDGSEFLTEVLQIAGQLEAVERWREALAVLERVPADAAGQQAAFWRLTGICLYHLAQYEAAAECFTRVSDWGAFTEEIQSYQQWLREAEGNG